MAPARWWYLMCAALPLLTLTAGCTDDSTDRRRPPLATAGPRYALPVQVARPGETPLPTRAVRQGVLIVTPLTVAAGMATIVGTHAEFSARGRFARVRILVENDSPTSRLFDASAQRLLGSDGQVYSPSRDAMNVKRQPNQTSVGAHNLLVTDLWFDLPIGVAPAALRVVDVEQPGPPSTVPVLPR